MGQLSGIYLKTKDKNFHELLKTIYDLGEKHFTNKSIKPHSILTVKKMTRTHQYGFMGMVTSTRIDKDDKLIYFKCIDTTLGVKQLLELKKLTGIEVEHYIEEHLNLNENNSVIEEFKWA